MTIETRKLYVIAERRVLRRGNLNGLEPIFNFVVNTSFGAAESRRVMKAAYMRSVVLDLVNAPDDFAARCFDRQARSKMWCTAKICRIEIGPDVVVHQPFSPKDLH